MELNREQIIKALECCVKAKTHGDCIMLKCPALIDDECVYGGEDEQECFRKQMSDVLSLIKELTEENEKTKQQCDKAMHGQLEAYQNNLKYFEDVYNKELDKLKAEKADVTYFKAELIADTVRKVKEKLTEKMYENIEGRRFRILYEDEIDQIIKEITL